jgi:hypothetical protein
MSRDRHPDRAAVTEDSWVTVVDPRSNPLRAGYSFFLLLEVAKRRERNALGLTERIKVFAGKEITEN